MWKVINASIIGSSHISSGTPCQDDNITDIVLDNKGNGCIVCLAADGAGSASEGGKGAEISCLTAIASIEQSIQTSSEITNQTVVGWVEDIRHAIGQEVELTELTYRDYACTFLGAVVTKDSSILFQIGDGAIVASSNGVQGVVFWPESGLYANMTYFITDDNALDNLHIVITKTPFDEMAILTDGLQRLSLLFDSQTPHRPFFESMIKTLRQQPVDEIERLGEQLSSFLGSERINERTDDDKTLILAVRVD